ncbi:MAG: ParA family protein [Deltaproteobacteria bacterium]|nr:ParA family protein [Deltaproteobacteria bacterium]
MSQVIAISNQKGGVGKTTSAVSIASELALMGRKVLLIDFDPQGNATSGLGVQIAEEGEDLYDMFFGEISLSSVVQNVDIKGLETLKVAASTRDLVGVEIELGKKPGRELILKTQLKLLRASFDYVIIDCPPSLGLLTLNALGAADSVLIPLQSEYYALEGVSALLETINFVTQTFNPKLQIAGVFLTMFDSRTNLSNQVLDEARNYFGDLLFGTTVPRSIRLSEAPSHGLPIGIYDPGSAGGRAYAKVAEELDERVFGLNTARKVAN